MNFKQIQSTAANMAVLFVISIGGALAVSRMENWQDIKTTLIHGASLGGAAAFGWLAMKSPWADKARELTSSTTVTKSVTVETKNPPKDAA